MYIVRINQIKWDKEYVKELLAKGHLKYVPITRNKEYKLEVPASTSKLFHFLASQLETV